MKNIIKYLGFPIILFLTTYPTIKAIEAGYHKTFILYVMSLAVLLVMLAVERIIPYQEKWNKLDSEVKNDLFHMVFGTGLGALLGNTLVLQVAGALRGGSLLRIWPTAWPLWSQVLLLFLASDLGRYVQHRLHHRSSFLWQFHVLHHNSPSLNVFKAARSHIVERILQQIFMFGILFIVGLPAEVYLLFAIPNTFLGALSHANADLRIGPLEYVIMGPHSHRVHHSLDTKEGNMNFGSALVVWDILFGTYIGPKDRIGKPLIEVGVPENPVPGGVFKQALYPLFRQ